jgi:cytochrome b
MTGNETIRTTRQPTGTLVWDPLVRFGHWALVAAFRVAFFSPEEGAGGPGAWHVRSGYLGSAPLWCCACCGALSARAMHVSATSSAGP